MKSKVVNYYKSLKKSGKIAFWIIFVLIIMGLVLSLMFTIGAIGTQININYAKKIEYIGSKYTPTCDSENYWTFTLNENDEEFKVVQLTDIHIGGGCFSLSKDRKAIDSVYSLIKYNKPDLIAVTGDMTFTYLPLAGTLDNGSAAKMVISLLDAMGIPYCPVFGNHDADYLMFKSKEKIAKQWEKGKYSLFKEQSGVEKDVFGHGNYIVKVLNPNETIHSAYIFMDSNSYVLENRVLLNGGYDNIHQDQVDWYKREIDKLNGAKSFIFFHIPLPEFIDAWNAYEKGDSDAKYYFGYKTENPCAAPINSGLFDAILEKGSTLGVFCGHDHVNNYSIEYKGIRLTYGLSIDFIAYFGIKNSNFQRGCTILKSSGGENYSISQCILAGITGYNKYKLK